MAQCKTVVSPLLMHWRYCSPAPNHHIQHKAHKVEQRSDFEFTKCQPYFTFVGHLWGVCFFETQLYKNTKIFFHQNALETIISKALATLFRPQWVKSTQTTMLSQLWIPILTENIYLLFSFCQHKAVLFWNLLNAFLSTAPRLDRLNRINKDWECNVAVDIFEHDAEEQKMVKMISRLEVNCLTQCNQAWRQQNEMGKVVIEIYELSYFGLVMPQDDKDLGQHWLR